MASIYKEFLVDAPADFVWAAIKDVGAVHARLAAGFVTDTVFADGVRTVTFANGFVVREQIVDISDEHRRLCYAAVGGRAFHHNAVLQVFPETDTSARILWVTDLLPDEARDPVARMVDAGAGSIKTTLEQAFSASH